MTGRVYSFLGVQAPFDPNFSLVTSPVLPPLALAVLRLTFAIYGTFFTLFRLIYEGVLDHTDASFFSYFTTLTYIGIFSYFWASGVQTLAFARTLRRGAPPAYPLQTWPRPLQFLHLLLLSTIATFPILVTAIFWSLLSSPATLATPYSAWTNISGHAFNTLFVGVDILFSNVAPALPRRAGSGIGLPWVHVPFLILLLGGYLGVAYVTYATQGFYTYDFLDPSTQHALLAAYIVGIAAAEVVIFVVVRYVMMLRHALVLRYAPDRAGFAASREAYAQEDADADEKKRSEDQLEENWKAGARASVGEAV